MISNFKNFLHRLFGNTGAKPATRDDQSRTDTRDRNGGVSPGAPPRSGRANPLVPGHLTQHPESNKSSGLIQVVIGLDFGTAFTKVVIGERRRAYAVPFVGLVESGRNPYLLPGNLSIEADGRVRLGVHTEARIASDLKMRILSGDHGRIATAEATAFIALVLQEAREWFLTTHAGTFRNHVLDWYINVGLPTEQYHDDSLVDFYRAVVDSAWLASTRTSTLDLQAIEECLALEEWSLGEDRIGLFPEFAAQINGYVRSPMRRNDLHLLVDIGAGTIDVAVFNVYKRDDMDLFPVFAKSVSPLGVHFLHKHRLEQTGGVATNHPQTLREGASDEEVARALGLDSAGLRQVDATFRLAVFEQVQKDISIANRRYPLSRHWADGLPFFLCGGGAQVEMYSSLATSMVHQRSPCRLNRMQMPRPNRLVMEGAADTTYDRLSVAYGLSFDQLDIGEVERSDQIHDDEEPPPAHPRRTCPRCMGTGGAMANGCTSCGGSGWVG